MREAAKRARLGVCRGLAKKPEVVRGERHGADTERRKSTDAREGLSCGSDLSNGKWTDIEWDEDVACVGIVELEVDD